MKHIHLSIINILIIFTGFFIIKCGDLPTDPSKEPKNVIAQLSVMDLASGVFQGDSTTIRIIVRYPDLTKKIKISFDPTIPDDTIYCKTGFGAFFDTLYVTRKFSATGTKKVLIDIDLINGEIKSFYCSFDVIEKKLSVAFDTVPKSHRVITGFSDTMIFSASTNQSGSGIEFSVNSQPLLDTTKLKIIDLGLRVKVITTTPIDTIYRIAVIAQSGTARDTAFTELISCKKPVLNEVSSISTISLGKSDTLAFTLHVKASDTVNMIKLLNTTSFVSGEIAPIATSEDLLSFVFHPTEIKIYVFSIEATVNNMKDTISYTIFVVKASFQPWKQDTVTLNAIEGEVLTLSMASYLTDTTLVNFQLKTDKGTVDGKVLSYLIPNDGNSKDSITVTITKNSGDSSKIKFHLNISKSDTLKFTVVYLGNTNTAGIVPVDTNKYSAGELVPVATAGTLVKAGYTFTGWNTVAAGSGTAHPSGTTFIKGVANDTLYAQWTSNPTFTVTYNGNGNTGGIVPADSNRYETGTSVTVVGAGTLEKNGYTFTGWNTDEAGSGTACAAGVTFTKSAANDTLYAQWTKNPIFTVIYSGNGNTGGNIPVDTNGYETGASVTVATAGSLFKTGYTFAGWNTVAAGSGTVHPEATTYKMGVANDTLYAQWTIITYSITYAFNGGTNNGANPTTYTIETPTITLNAPVREGYSFVGWYSNVDFSGIAVTQVTKGNSGNIILYAKFQMNAPVVTTSPTNRNCPVNDTVTFTVIARGINLTFQWYKNGTEIAGATASSYITQALTVNDLEAAPVYFCLVSNPAGNVTSAGATLTVSTLTDIESNLYHLVKIGSQIWTMENLRVTKYNDGTAIPKDTTTETWSATTPKYCFYNNTSNVDSMKMFGALYNWHVVSPTNANKLAPDGWHIPTDEEWTALSDYIGGSSVAGGKLKETGTAHWTPPNTGATNETGFSAVPGGYRYGNGGFYDIGLYSAWWSAMEVVATHASYLRAYYDSADLSSIAYFKSCGFSVRLLKD